MRALFRFAPILAGATLPDRLIASLGAAIGILVTGVLCGWLFASNGAWPLIVAPMGASAVLVYVVPASPLAQPWPVIGGNVLSALVGVLVARVVTEPAAAAALAVAGAILLMSLTRSLHPPGGAVALSTVVGGASVHAAGFSYALMPVGVNAIILVGVGLVFHRVTGRSYPHRPLVTPSAPAVAIPHADDLDRALAEMGEAFDVSREDLAQLLGRIAVLTDARRR